METVLVVGGCGIHVCEGVRRPIARGDVFVVDTTRNHHYEAPSELSVWLMLYDERYMISFAPALSHLEGFRGFFHVEPAFRSEFGLDGVVHLSEGETLRAERALSLIGDEKRTRPDGYALRCTCLFVEFLVELCRRFVEADGSVIVEQGGLADIVALLRYRPARDFSLAELARHAGTSVSTFSRRFRQATGTTPKQYRIEVRLQSARRLLVETESSVGEIATKTGFASGSHLARAFRTRFGCSPTGFRAGQPPWDAERID